MTKIFLRDKAIQNVVKTEWDVAHEFKGGDLWFKFPHNNEIIEVLIPEEELKYYCLKMKEKEVF
ncbi:MAG: hypothetical protein QXP52_02285 [Candidatus Aenigmatarchaeota archaeon]